MTRTLTVIGTVFLAFLVGGRAIADPGPRGKIDGTQASSSLRWVKPGMTGSVTPPPREQPIHEVGWTRDRSCDCDQRIPRLAQSEGPPQRPEPRNDQQDPGPTLPPEKDYEPQSSDGDFWFIRRKRAPG